MLMFSHLGPLPLMLGPRARVCVHFFAPTAFPNHLPIQFSSLTLDPLHSLRRDMYPPRLTCSARSGWTPPPRADGQYELPRPPPDVNCTTLPCAIGLDSPYVAGHTMLFDVVGDMFEEHNVAAQNPAVVAQLLARLNTYNMSHCGGTRCLPDNAGGAKGKPTQNDPRMPAGEAVWLPWRGDPTPSKCDTNRASTPVPGADVRSNLDPPSFKPGKPGVLHLLGWCWDHAWAGGGVPPMLVRVSVDGKVVHDRIVANVTRAGLPSKTGAPNTEHGFDLYLKGADAKTLAGATGVHRLDVDVHVDPSGSAAGGTVPIKNSPVCFRKGGTVCECPPEVPW